MIDYDVSAAVEELAEFFGVLSPGDSTIAGHWNRAGIRAALVKCLATAPRIAQTRLDAVRAVLGERHHTSIATLGGFPQCGDCYCSTWPCLPERIRRAVEGETP